MHIKKLLLLTFLLPFICQAQQPVLKIAGKDSVRVQLKNYTVNVKVVGNTAVTTMEMQFCNTAPRVLEGELTFPMPDGVSISRYAIDINGKMREAVPVEKEKGQVVFENIVRKNVDPGLLEKTEGNNFRTRIYPIPANGCRRILIAYEQDLKMTDKTALVYSLPLHFKNPIPNFKIDFKVFSAAIPEVGSACNTDLKFENINEVWSSGVNKQNFKPDGSFTVVIPKLADAVETVMKQSGSNYYFMINNFPVAKEIEKPIPNNVGIIWDVSLSGLNRDHSKEFDLIDEYVKKKSNLQISVNFIGYDFVKGNTYSINSGNWSLLQNDLEKIIYDGATNLSNIKSIGPADEYLFFSDGLHTFGNLDYGVLPNKPLYCINSSANANYTTLKYIAAKTGGAFINLNEQPVMSALKQLTQQTLQFLGIKQNNLVTELYPAVATPIIGNIAVSGICSQAITSITLQFGYGQTVSFEKTIELNATKQQSNFIDIEKIWAQKKINTLEFLTNENKKQITELGKKYGIVTSNTSLIVLDDVADYVKYEIDPPAELKAEYAKLTAEKNKAITKIDREAISKAVSNYGELKNWWNKEFRIENLKKIKANTDNISNRSQLDSIRTYNINHALVGRISGVTIQSQSGVTGSSPTVRLRGEQTNFASTNSYFTSTDKEDDKVFMKVEEPAAFSATPPAPPTVEAVRLTPPRIVEDEKLVDNKAIYSWSTGADTTRRMIGTYDTIASGYINVEERVPERPYSKILDSATTENLYSKYLELRKENINDPVFYFDVAKKYFKTNNEKMGLKILSNIADLNFDDHELYKLLGYQLMALKQYDEAVNVFRKVLQWRPQEPQSYRDYALALTEVGKYQNALDTLYLSLTKNFDEDITDLYPGIEEITVTEINNLIALYGSKLNLSKIDKRIIKNLPFDVRVVLNWNFNDTDMDLWVTDPNDEKCFYSNKDTKIGGHISNDFTRGYGPEQFMLKKAMKGKYKVEVDYYGDTQQKLAGPTTVLAQIFTNYGKPNQTSKTIAIQMQPQDKGGVFIGEFEF